MRVMRTSVVRLPSAALVITLLAGAACDIRWGTESHWRFEGASAAPNDASVVVGGRVARRVALDEHVTEVEHEPRI